MKIKEYQEEQQLLIARQKRTFIDSDTGEIFENATIAEFHYQGYKSGNLSKACTGKNKTFAGFRWEYI